MHKLGELLAEDREPAQGRRGFLKVSAAWGGGLLVSHVFVDSVSADVSAAANPIDPKTAGSAPTMGLGAWLRIGRDGSVVFMMSQSEMGQGSHTGLAMVVAEELDASYANVNYEQAPVEAAYFNPRYIGLNGGQGTGGSSSISQVAPVLRLACAAARTLLVQVAAARWGVPMPECSTDASVVTHGLSGRRFGYGELAEDASRLTAPEKPVLKNPADFKLLGRPMPRRDTPAKVNGSAQYGLDVILPGMLTAVVARNPVFGRGYRSFDDSLAKRAKGVAAVVPISAGIAVVADTFWRARSAREKLKVDWDATFDPAFDSKHLSATMESLMRTPGIVARNDGDAQAAFAQAAKKISAVYESQYLDCSPLEPMNATAWVRGDRCEVWAPMQFQSRALSAAQRITGLSPERITIHTTYLGGGFGRRFFHDFVEQALEVSTALKKPVKLMFTREDDMTHSFYRPASRNLLEAGLDEHGNIVSWRHKAVSKSILGFLWPERVAKTGLDGTATQGASNLPYALPNYQVEWVPLVSPAPVGIWRSVGDSQNAFVTQSFMDELAYAAGKDPYEFRRALLEKVPRLRAVLDLVAEKAGWGQPLPAGVFRGIAAVTCYGALAAQVAEVSVDAEGRINVLRIVAALDAGWVANPDSVRQQAEGGVMYGLSAAMGEEITIAQGRVEQTNFHQYPVMRFPQMPKVEFHLIRSTEPALSVGEPAGTPCVAPAVANAVFAATGVRMRSMPFSKVPLRRA